MAPDTCPKCNSHKVSIINSKSVLNPLKGSCNNKSCQNRYYLRQYSFFKFFPTIPAQIIMKIIELMLIEKKCYSNQKKFKR